MFVKDEEGLYTPSQTSYTREQLITYARGLVGSQFRKRVSILDPSAMKNYLVLHFTEKENEEFWAVFLDNRHRVLKHEVMFTGTVDSASVYPRVIAQRALRCNAAALTLAHNHPSGVAEPSRADVEITKKVKTALDLVDVRLLDHFIIGGGTITSLAERGEI